MASLKFFSKDDHVHQWNLVSKTYAAPVRQLIGEMASNPEIFQKVLFGVTTFLWNCECGAMKKEELIGSDSDTLSDILDKVDKDGPQKINRGADVYLVGKQPPMTQTPVPLPPLPPQEVIPLR